MYLSLCLLASFNSLLLVLNKVVDSAEKTNLTRLYQYLYHSNYSRSFSFISSVGNAENISFNLSIGIARKPKKVSYGGLFGAEG